MDYLNIIKFPIEFTENLQQLKRKIGLDKYYSTDATITQISSTQITVFNKIYVNEQMGYSFFI